MAARGDDQVLFAICIICHRCCVSACRKLCLPKFSSSLHIEGANIGIVIVVLNLEVRIVSRASAEATEEGDQVPCDRRWFLSRGEVPAALKDCPALDVV